MTAKRVDMHRLQEFVRLHRLGARSAREVAGLMVDRTCAEYGRWPRLQGTENPLSCRPLGLHRLIPRD